MLFACLESIVLEPLEFLWISLVPCIEDVCLPLAALNLAQLKTFFHSSLASELITHINRKIKNPWRELNTVKRIWNVSLTPWGDWNVSIAKSQVSPKRNITPPMLINKRMILFLSTDLSLMPASLLRFLDLKCRMSTTITQIKMTMLKSMMRRSGPRNEAQNAAMWDKKQLWDSKKYTNKKKNNDRLSSGPKHFYSYGEFSLICTLNIIIML